MLDAILRRFVPDYENINDPAVRKRYGLLAGSAGLGLNLLLFAVKLCAGVLTGAISVTADAFNNLSDAAGAAVTLVGFRLAAQRADERHPFGHGRMEYLAGLAVSMLILLVGVELAQNSIEKILSPEKAVLTPLAGALLLLSILVKLWMGWFNAALGKRISSPALSAAALDARTDVLATWWAWSSHVSPDWIWTAGWACWWRRSSCAPAGPPPGTRWTLCWAPLPLPTWWRTSSSSSSAIPTSWAYTTWSSTTTVRDGA